MATALPSPLTVETEREADGRWLAEIPAIPGVLAYAQTESKAISAVQALALRVIADKLEHGEIDLGWTSLTFAAA